MTSPTKLTAVPAWTFFLPYLIVPVTLVFLLANYLGHWQLQHVLPQSSEKIFVFGIIFENPHIIASNLIMLDKEYLHFYRTQLIVRVSVVALLSLALIFVAGPRAFYTFFYAFTVYHVARQQMGIGKMFNRQPSRAYTMWAWAFVAISLMISVGVGYFKTGPSLVPVDIVRVVIIYGTYGLVIAGATLVWLLKSQIGRYYLVANMGLLVATTLCFLNGMPFFAILLPRIVHDTTAFLIYTNHDFNRNTPVPQHFLYRATHGLFPIWLTCILVAISWGALVTYSGKLWVIFIVIVLTLMHYITEAFTWKTGSLHRRYLKIGF